MMLLLLFSISELLVVVILLALISSKKSSYNLMMPALYLRWCSTSKLVYTSTYSDWSSDLMLYSSPKSIISFILIFGGNSPLSSISSKYYWESIYEDGSYFGER